jgi:hypothetical protein
VLEADRSAGLGDHHTMDHDKFIKSQLASKQLTLGPYVVHTWSRDPPKFEALKPSCGKVKGVGGRSVMRAQHV